MSKESGLLTYKQVLNPKGCGAGTENACFAITSGIKGFECMLITCPQMAQLAGISLGWRVNVDQQDNKVWCPLGVLDNSKTE